MSWPNASGGGGTVSVDGHPYLRMPDGSLMALTIPAGTPISPTIAGAWEMRVLIDAGADEDHGRVGYTINPSSAAVSSARLANPEDHPEDVFIAATAGGLAGTTREHDATSITSVYVGICDEASSTVAAGSTATPGAMVLLTFAEEAGVIAIEVAASPSNAGGGSNQRYRPVIIRGFAGSSS